MPIELQCYLWIWNPNLLFFLERVYGLVITLVAGCDCRLP